jgi:hypothetical protein
LIPEEGDMPDPIYATDEDIALRASADFAILCPRDQKLAAGLDGAFDPSDRWTLQSASVDFTAQGVLPGQVVQLLGPASAFRAPGEGLIVVAANGHTVTLRRKGQPAGAGQPPAPANGLVGVEFLIATLAPQIQGASVEVNIRVGVCAMIPGRTAADLLNPLELRDAVVLTTLQRQYRDMSREASGANLDALATKALAVKDELDDLLARTIVHWKTAAGTIADAPSMPFSARISR